MIMATPKPRRFCAAYDHFFRLSLALRALETCGKPVAAAIAGLALGGGGELALASHYRVLTDDKHAAIGLPESLVGLLPGAGGTQRLPRLVGVERAMPLLLHGKRLAGEAAVDAGLAHRVVKAGEEDRRRRGLAALLAGARAAVGPRRIGSRRRPRMSSAALEPVRSAALEASLGHYPAVFAILDCVEFGLPQSFEGGMRSEMTSFSHLVLRPEPRAMIQTMFLGRVDYERLERKGSAAERSRCGGRMVKVGDQRATAAARGARCRGLCRPWRGGAAARAPAAGLLDRERRSAPRARRSLCCGRIHEAARRSPRASSEEDSARRRLRRGEASRLSRLSRRPVRVPFGKLAVRRVLTNGGSRR